ncbi:slc38a7 [Scenedesmus sp. PABB004]|nr:slc38a7 [Scenedesmus sp. PABB004]
MATFYNPRPQPVEPEARVEVEEGRGLTGRGAPRLRVVLGTEGASSLSSVATLCNSAIGAGVLSLPFAFAAAGLVGCLILCLVVAASEAFTMYVLAKFAERYDAPSYGSLVRRALGKRTAALLSGVLLVYLWGSCVAYLVIVADTATSLSALHLGPAALASQRPVVLAAAGALVTLLCFPRHLSALENMSFLAVLGFLYTAGVVLLRGLQAVAARPDPWAGVALFRGDVTALYAISIAVYGFNCHANVVSVFYELEHYPSPLIPRLPASPSAFQGLGRLAPKPRTYKLIGMLGAILSAQAVIFVGYMAVGIAGFLAYPDNVSSNILNSFPPDDVLMQVHLGRRGALGPARGAGWAARRTSRCAGFTASHPLGPLTQVARGVIGFVVLAHYPLNHHPARRGWEDLLDAVAGVKTIPPWLSAVMTVVFVWSNVATAMVVRDLGEVLHIIGGTAACFMIFFLPGLLLMNAAIIKHTASSADLTALDAGSEASPYPPSAAGDDPGTPLLLDRRAGFRQEGLVFAPAKGWWAGLALVVVALCVLSVTLITSLMG